ncbi:MAG TPA: LptF/LptG family permease, partial [Aliiroseovarius sp.]|nr:LptF/LptG family permease [Aliiroseovarius sp.]
FDDFSYSLEALITGGGPRRPDVRELSTAALLGASPVDQARTGKSADVLVAEGHARIAQPLQAVVLALLGVSALMLGRYSRFGVTRQILLAVVAVIGVQMLTNLSIDIARESTGGWPLLYLPAAFGALVSLIFLILAAYPGLLQRPRGPEAMA